MSVAENLAAIRERIASACERAGRPVDAVRLVAVAKKQSIDKVREVLKAGQRDIGENYGQELRDKAAALVERPPEWHFIGPIQSNKVRYVAAHADWVHTIDRLSIARELKDRCDRADRTPRVLVEVNIAREPQKSGVDPEAAAELVHALRTLGLPPRGLMCMPPFDLPLSKTTAYFAALRELGQSLAGEGALDSSHELSMGMSEDFEQAILEGATMVRVGTAIFGTRG
ncbi:MAG: YggS family pyridoxal phosphate-dependent enzyme [Pseudomonadota bacterium]